MFRQFNYMHRMHYLWLLLSVYTADKNRCFGIINSMSRFEMSTHTITWIKHAEDDDHSRSVVWILYAKYIANWKLANARLDRSTTTLYNFRDKILRSNLWKYIYISIFDDTTLDQTKATEKIHRYETQVWRWGNNVWVWLITGKKMFNWV